MSMTTLLERIKSSRKTRVVLIAIALIPLIYAGTLTVANVDPSHNLDNVPAAIVNLDEPASAGDVSLALGDTLTEELTTSTSTSNFTWTEMGVEDAVTALGNGDILAVLTIPEDFSASAASLAAEDPGEAQAAMLSIETNDGSNMIAGTIASTIAATVRTTLATQVSAEYLANIYLGFTTIHDSIAEASSGATQLADGASTAESASTTLVVGLNDLADGASLLESATSDLASGAANANAGAQKLTAGLNTLEDQTTQFPTDTESLSAGATRVDSGATELADGLTVLTTNAQQLASGAASAYSGSQQLTAGLDSLTAQTPELASGATTVADNAAWLVNNWETLTDAQRKSAMTAIAQGASTVSAGATATDSAAAQLASASNTLTGSSASATGLAAISAGTSALSAGIGTASSGANDLAKGASQVAAGAATLAAKAPALTTGISEAATGATDLAAGTAKLAAGTATLADKTADLSSGSANVAAGAAELSMGLTTLSDGAEELSTGLEAGIDSIPTYSDDEADALSTVAANPVNLNVTRQNEVPEYGYGLAPYFTALALWVGALGYFLMMPALTRRALNGRGTPLLAAVRSFAPAAAIAAVQSLLTVGILTLGVGITPANTWGLLGMITLTSLTFFAINQALIALLGAPGRFLALILIVIQLAAAGGTYPIQTAPGFFQVIHPWMPLTYSVEAFRSLIAGGDIGVAHGIWVLLAWMLGALAVTVLASHRARTASQDSPDLLAAREAHSHP